VLFNSIIFIIFSIVFFSFFWIIKKQKKQIFWAYIILFSFIFYGWWDWRFLFLIILSGFIDFFAGKLIYQFPKYKKYFLFLSLVGNIGILGLFKYSRFILEQIELLLYYCDINVELIENIPEFIYVLPIGISFYTFQSMSYTIDIYRGDLVPTNNVLKFFAYLSMFPQLVAGPIVRSKTLMPQLERLKLTNEIERWHGLKLIAFGFFKKVLLADNIAPLVNTAFVDINKTDSSLYWWMVMLGFSFQIYLDFSGYTDIARGLAKWMGFHFKMNFNHPYLSSSLREFWRRWHISLSTWFRDYVYIPLGGSKKGRFRSHLNMWITMIISGFWHGASWNFIIWGCLHAIYLSIERLLKWPKMFNKVLTEKFAVLFIMIQIILAWVFFRAQSISDSLKILRNMLYLNTDMDFKLNVDIKNGLYFVLFAVIIEYGLLKFKLRNIITNKRTLYYLEIALLAVIVSFTIFLRGKGHEFIYFQF